MNPQKRQIVISLQTKEKVEAAKLYIERRYAKLLQQEREKRENWELLYKKMQSLNLSEQEQERVKLGILHKEAERLRQNRKKLSIKNYDLIKIIGRGAFGEVRLCREKETGQPVAIKKMKKSLMINKNKVNQAQEEKHILAFSENNPWIVDLKCSFQDEKSLYLVMEYLPGGDLMNLLMKKDIFTEEEARFYTAEILLALDTVHNLHYIHRDLKPDNILIDANGHIKLSDFGLCKHTEIRPKKLNESVSKKEDDLLKKRGLDQLNFGPKQQYRRNRKLAYSAVGTPDYVAPEVQGKTGYTETVDWWSMGVILYEMLVGYPPFASEEPSETWHKILNWKKYFTIPKEANLSVQAIDLIRRLINDAKDRLGINGVDEIKSHPFFYGIDWKRLREKKAPYIPEVKNSFDADNFDPFEQEEAWDEETANSSKKGVAAGSSASSKKPSRKDINFIGYTFKKTGGQQSELVKALIDLDSGHIPCLDLERSNTNNYCESLLLQKPRIELTEDQRRKIFKKDKEDGHFKEMKEMLSMTSAKIYTNRNNNGIVKKPMHLGEESARLDETPGMINNSLGPISGLNNTMNLKTGMNSMKIHNNFLHDSTGSGSNNNNNSTAKGSKERSVKQSPSQFSKEKEEAIKKLMMKSNLKINPINLMKRT